MSFFFRTTYAKVWGTSKVYYGTYGSGEWFVYVTLTLINFDKFDF